MDLIGRSDVIAAFRLLLGREPEREETIEQHQAEYATPADLARHLMTCEEFQHGWDSPGFLAGSLAFHTAFGRLPNREEVETLRRYFTDLRPTSAAAMLRLTVMLFSRQHYPTAIGARFAENELEIVEPSGTDQRLVLDGFDRSVARTIITTRTYEPHLGRFFRAVLRPDMVCLDIGANVGFHTFMMRSLVGDGGHVFAFEPNSENCRMILLSVRENDARNITVLPVALSDRLGSIAFSTAIGSNGGIVGTADDTLLDSSCSVVPTFRLDDVITPDRVDFIKIDVEGAEPLVIAGAQALIARHRPIIVSEFSDYMLRGTSGTSGAAYIDHFKGIGYRACTLGYTGPIEAIEDARAFVDGWPETRIEDVAFVPVETTFDLAAYARG